MKMLRAIRCAVIVSVASLLVLTAYAAPASDAQISESVSIGIEGNSTLLVKGTPVQVIRIEGNNSVIGVRLPIGVIVQTAIPTKYLVMDSQQSVLVDSNSVLKPMPVAIPGPDLSKLSSASSDRKVVTFNIENIHVHSEVENIREGIMIEDPTSTVLLPKPRIFIPQVEVKISVAKDAQSKNLIAKAYYYDGSGRLIQTFDQPSVAVRNVTDGVGGGAHASVWPTVLPMDKRISIYFPLPANLPTDWTLVVVFGNSRGAVAASLPDGQEQHLSYPEHDLVAKTLMSPEVTLDDADKPAPIIEQVVKSENLAYPSFTLLMHLPHGVTDPKSVNGILATCIIADSVGQIRDQLNAIQPQGDPNPYFAYAEAHKMAIIAWGARWVWSSYANFDELNKDQNRNWDDNFQTLADAWDRGVQSLVDNYGIPDHDYLMYGLCAGGEWVHRLALHKPDRFLAVQMHISTSYDAPTPEASHVMWLLTTGELDSGCDRARRFYSAAKALDYPIVFKAFIGLGHGDSLAADQLGTRFFDYALAVKSKRDAANANDLRKSQPLDLSGFNTSPFYGDLMNQEMFSAQDKQMIPTDFLVSLPNKDIADAWNQ